MSVVVIGDTNVDLVIRLPDLSPSHLHANPDPLVFGGGSAANTAAALARLDVGCSFVGAVGDDGYGRLAVASLDEVGVDTTGVLTTTEVPTVMVLAVVKPNGDRLIYVWPPRGGAHSHVQPDDAIAAVEDAEWLHVSGICLRSPPARDALLAAMAACQDRGVPVSFDLNLRLENWGWEDGFRETVREAIDRSDVVMGSARDEITALTGVDDPGAAATSLARSEQLVIARLGADGALAASASGLVMSPGFPATVSDTLGAGDAFNAGFIAARIRKLPVVRALQWGNAVAALTIAHPGARTSPSASEVAELLDG